MLFAAVILFTCLLENGESYVTPLQCKKAFLERAKPLSVLQETVGESVEEGEEIVEEVVVEEEAMKLYLGGLPTTYDNEKIRELIEPFCDEGVIKSIAVPTDRFTGSPRGFAFIELSKEAGLKAIEELNDSEIEGRFIKCNEQLSKEELMAQRGSRPKPEEEPG